MTNSEDVSRQEPPLQPPSPQEPPCRARLRILIGPHAQQAVLARRAAASTGFQRTLSVAMLVLILPGSKFVILWLEDVIFGDAVSLGGFWSVTILVFALTGARWGVRHLVAPAVR